MKFILILFVFLISVNVFAISETNYKNDYQNKIVPLLNKFKHGSFKGEEGVLIHYATYKSNPSTNRCMFILPGRSEPLEKYAEIVYDLDNGSLSGKFKYFLMDHRGQGRSERMIKKGPEASFKGHVDRFEYYALDVKTFIDSVNVSEQCRDINVLAHSLGAGILVDFMQKYPEVVDRAFLSSPMLKIQTAPYKYSVAKTIIKASMLAGLGKSFAIGQKTFNGERDFENNTFTTSKERYEMTMNLYDVFPETRLGGVTNRWLNEVMSGTFHIRSRYEELRIPLKVVHAGLESYSESSEMIKLCEKAPYCNRLYLESSKHEVLMDRDNNRNLVISEIEKFFI